MEVDREEVRREVSGAYGQFAVLIPGSLGTSRCGRAGGAGTSSGFGFALHDAERFPAHARKGRTTELDDYSGKSLSLIIPPLRYTLPAATP
jgi:hypothetical protein